MTVSKTTTQEKARARFLGTCPTETRDLELIRDVAEFADSCAAELQKENAQIKRLLALLYDKWENGDNCYEDPEDCTGFLGHAFKLKLEEEEEILSALKGEPVTLINRAALSKEKAQ